MAPELVASPPDAAVLVGAPPAPGDKPAPAPGPRPGHFQEPPPSFEATIRLLRQRLHDYDVDRAADRLKQAVVRGATAGLALRGGLHLVSYLVGLLMARRAKGKKAAGHAAAVAAAAARPAALELVKDTLRWGAFLGSFAGVFVTSDEAIALLGGRKRTQAYRALVSGFLAGPTLLLTGPKARHTSLAIYILLRGLALLIRCANLPGAHPRMRVVLAPTRWRHGDTALMCLSTAQIVYSWIVMPKTLPPAYTRFLNKHGGRELFVYEGVRELLQMHKRGRGPFQLSALAGSPHKDYCGTIPCEFLHPGQRCRTQPLSFFPTAYLRALPVYLPVYVIPALLVHGRSMVRPRTALHIWTKVAAGVLRSSLFLSSYCTLAWVGVCTGFNLTGKTTPWVLTGFSWIAGLATLFEKKSRRMELALYCLSRVVEAFGLCLAEWGYVSAGSLPRRLDVLLFSCATAAILHCYSDHHGQRRAVFRSKYLTVFDAILGNTGFENASIRHVPSNTDLVARLGLRISTSMQQLITYTGGNGNGGDDNGGGGGGSSRRASQLWRRSSAPEGGFEFGAGGTPTLGSRQHTTTSSSSAEAAQDSSTAASVESSWPSSRGSDAAGPPGAALAAAEATGAEGGSGGGGAGRRRGGAAGGEGTGAETLGEGPRAS